MVKKLLPETLNVNLSAINSGITLDEVRVLKRVIREKINIFGKCRLLSEAMGKIDKCECALCQIDEMNVEELKKTVGDLISKGYNGFELRAFIT